MVARTRICCALTGLLAAAVASLSGCGLGVGTTGGGVFGANQPTDMVHAAVATFIDKEALPGQSGGGAFNSSLKYQSADAAVTLSPELEDYQYSRNGTFPSERPEYARRDAALNAGKPGPLLASAEWPTPQRPPQEPFPFRYWRWN